MCVGEAGVSLLGGCVVVDASASEVGVLWCGKTEEDFQGIRGLFVRWEDEGEEAAARKV